MNLFKKMIFQACLIGCLIPGASIIASQPEQDIPTICPDEVQNIANLYEHVVMNVNQIEANIQHIIELVTSKKLKVSNIEKTRQELIAIISNLENQKQEKIHLTIENIEDLVLINKVYLEYLLEYIPGKIDAISCDNLILKIQDFFTALYNNSQSIDSFEKILAENNTKLAQLSYACDTAGLSQINKIYRYLEQKNAFKNTYTYGTAGLAIASMGLFATYVYFNNIDRTQKDAHGDPITTMKFMAANCSKALPYWSNIANPCIENVIEPVATMATNLGYALTPTKPFDVLATLALPLSFHAKSISDYCGNQYQKFNNYLRGETGNAKNFSQASSAKKVYFKDLIGAQHLEKIAQEYIDYLKNPERYDRLGLAPSKAMLLVGPPQTGKSLFAAALHTAIEDEFKGSGKVGFIVVDRDALNQYSIEEIFRIAQYHAPCIIFIDEIDMIGADREKNPYQTGQLLTCMSGLNSGSSDKKVFVLAATNKPEQLDFALLQHGRFGKVVPFEYPKFAERKAILDKLIYDKAIILPQDFIIQLAQETEGLSFNAITSIITEAMRSAKQAARLVKPADIDEAFDKEVRKIAPYVAAQDNIQSKEGIAAYQAGKAAAYLLCNTEQKLAKVTIKPIVKKIEPKAGFSFSLNNKGDASSELKKDEPFTKESYRLGGVFTYHEIDRCEMQNNEDQEHDIMCLLAGKISQHMLLGKTYSKVSLEDTEQAKAAVHSICQDPLLTKDEMLKNSHQLEEKLHAKIAEILNNNKDLVEKLYKALLEKETLDRDMLKTFTA